VEVLRAVSGSAGSLLVVVDALDGPGSRRAAQCVMVHPLTLKTPHSPAQQRGGHVDVLSGAALEVPAAKGRVGRREDGGARVKRCGNARLRNAHSLLLHHLGEGLQAGEEGRAEARAPTWVGRWGNRGQLVGCQLHQSVGAGAVLTSHKPRSSLEPRPTSWILVRSPSSILSNSSMQQMPRSARTRAPPSRTSSLVTWVGCAWQSGGAGEGVMVRRVDHWSQLAVTATCRGTDAKAGAKAAACTPTVDCSQCPLPRRIPALALAPYPPGYAAPRL
jgi:hypothetical protein